MKIVTFNLLITIILLFSDRKSLISSKKTTLEEDYQLILEPSIENNLQIKNDTILITQNQRDTLESTISNLRRYQTSLENKIKSFEKSKKETLQLPVTSLARNIKKKRHHREKEDDNSLVFYNTLSLVMLSMLAGGLVGVLFILYFSFKKENDSFTK
jgi:hypothetical protein